MIARSPALTTLSPLRSAGHAGAQLSGTPLKSRSGAPLKIATKSGVPSLSQSPVMSTPSRAAASRKPCMSTASTAPSWLMSPIAQASSGVTVFESRHCAITCRSSVSTSWLASKSYSSRPSEPRNASSCDRCVFDSLANAAADAAPSPNGPCFWMAMVTRSSNVPPEAEPSCSIGSRVRRFHSTGVRNSCSLASPSCTPSASRPMSCTRKSE